MRFIDGKAELCEVVAADAEGVTLRLDHIPKPVKFKWWQLDPEDARTLRGGAPSLPVPGLEGATAGLRVRTKDNKLIEGIELPGAPAGVLRLKNARGTQDVPRASIESVEPARLEPSRIYSGEELFALLMSRAKPSTPEEFERVAAELLRLDLRERGLALLKMAESLRQPEGPESRIYRDLGRLREMLGDLALQRMVFNVQESALVGEVQAALDQIDALEAALAEAKGSEEVLKELRRLRAGLQELRGYGRDEQIVREVYRVFDALLKAKAMDRTAAYADAAGWVERDLPAEVFRHVNRRFNFSPGDETARAVWQRRPADLLLKHAVDEASWVVLRPDARPAADWWAAASDAARYKLLKGLAVEKHFHVARAETKSCGTCGGTGQVEPAGALCPACLGAKTHRVLIYR